MADAATPAPTKTVQAFDYNGYKADLTYDKNQVPGATTIMNSRESVQQVATIDKVSMNVAKDGRTLAKGVSKFTATAPGTYLTTTAITYRPTTVTKTPFNTVVTWTSDTCKVLNWTVTSKNVVETGPGTGTYNGTMQVQYRWTCNATAQVDPALFGKSVIQGSYTSYDTVTETLQNERLIAHHNTNSVVPFVGQQKAVVWDVQLTKTYAKPITLTQHTVTKVVNVNTKVITNAEWNKVATTGNKVAADKIFGQVGRTLSKHGTTTTYAWDEFKFNPLTNTFVKTGHSEFITVNGHFAGSIRGLPVLP
jgi:hypothetical protein